MKHGATGSNPTDVGDDVLNAVRQLGRPEPWLVGPSEQGVPIDDLLSGEFTVFGKQVQLVSPVDWSQDPHDNRSWRYDLHTLKWLKPLLLKYAEDGDPACLSVARDVLRDWADSHLEPTAEVSEFAWYDMAVGLRAPYFAYVLRASLVGGEIDVEAAELLLRTAERHGAELADETRYAAGHNHGLFQDEGLYLLARQLPVLPEAASWRSLALTRLRSTLEQTVNFSEGAHLEHSSAYQFSIAGLVARMAENIPEMSELHDLRDRLRRTAAWHVTPANRLAQLGDTDDVPAPKWACRTASKLHGMNALFETGQAFVREGNSYLAVSAGYHSSAHKHADDTGFILFENGVAVLGDSGRWGYYEDEPDRIYARSAFAHNVLTVDGEDFDWREAEPYGSGLEAAGEGAGWYAIVVRNPLLRRQGVEHRRLWLYRPSQILVIVDRLQADAVHEYVRHFHFGPRLEARRQQDDEITLIGPATSWTFSNCSDGTEFQLKKGISNPVRTGWAFPGDRERQPIWSAHIASRGASATLVTALHLSTTLPPVMSAELEGTSAYVVLENSTITLTVDGSRLSVRP